MKAGIFLMKWARSPQNEAKVPFKVDLPMALRNRVSGKSSVNKERGCLYEISLVLSCLEKNNFENKMCTEEAKNFQNCYKTYLNNRKFSKEGEMSGKLTPNAQNLKSKQINHLLKMYPQVNK